MKRRARSTEVADLSSECLSDVVAFLDARDKASLMAVSLDMHRAAGAAVHWQQLEVRGTTADRRRALVVCANRTDASHPLKSLTVEGTTAALEEFVTQADASRHDAVTCDQCAALIQALPGRVFHSLETLVLRRLPWLTACFTEHLLSNAPNLKVLEIEQNINVNRVVRQVAASCHELEVLCFKHIEVTSPFADTISGPQHCLEASAVTELTSACRKLKRVCFNHYVIEEESVQGLLKAPGLQEVDLSDNEGLHGFFLSEVPRAWPSLRTLALRDCTEMQETAVVDLVQELVNGACQQLTAIDVSCQWAHINESFLSDTALREELAKRRPHLVWREDHCQVPGFGIDPEEEIWLHSDDVPAGAEAQVEEDLEDGATVIDEENDTFDEAVRPDEYFALSDELADECCDELFKEKLPDEDVQPADTAAAEH